MKNFKAYTLLEVLVVMSIMLILLGVGLMSYTVFAETTQYNQDVANFENDILLIQRAAMLLERDPDERWLYGLGIDLGPLYQGTTYEYGTYRYFKWCSEFDDFGDERTTGPYPNYDGENGDLLNELIPNYSWAAGSCDKGVVGASQTLMVLDQYGSGRLNLDPKKVSIPPVLDGREIRYIVFEAVTGRTFFYARGGRRLDDTDMAIVFNKRFGSSHTLIIRELTGRTESYSFSELDLEGLGRIDDGDIIFDAAQPI
jgi:prepilin-type N-terminal cleavage/methylation domain-containing protein